MKIGCYTKQYNIKKKQYTFNYVPNYLLICTYEHARVPLPIKKTISTVTFLNF